MALKKDCGALSDHPPPWPADADAVGVRGLERQLRLKTLIGDMDEFQAKMRKRGGIPTKALFNDPVGGRVPNGFMKEGIVSTNPSRREGFVHG